MSNLSKIFGVIEEVVDAQPKYRPKSDRPPDACVVASSGTEVWVIEYIGPGLDYLYECDSDIDIGGDLPDLGPGMWLIDCELQSFTTYEGDYDCELVVLGQRMLTDDEMDAMRDHGSVLDASRWFLTEVKGAEG